MNRPARRIVEFRRRESVRSGAIRLARDLARQAHALRNSDWELAVVIHETRLILKQLRALTRLLRPALGEGFYTREYRRLRTASQSLATSRDAAVGLALLNRLQQRSRARDRKAWAQAITRFSKRVRTRSSSETRLRKHLERTATRLEAFTRALETAPWPEKDWPTLATGLRRSYRLARRRHQRAVETPSDEHLHAWRTAAKALLHQLRFLRPVAPAHLDPLLQNLDRLQDDLGSANDAVVVSRHLRSADDVDDPALAPVFLELNRLRTRLHRRALDRGTRLFTRTSAAFRKRLRRAWKQWRRKPHS